MRHEHYTRVVRQEARHHRDADPRALDRGLEVAIVGSVASRLTEKGSGIALNASQIGTTAAVEDPHNP